MFLRGQANEIRQETAQEAIKDFQKAYALASAQLPRSQAEKSLLQVLESKLNKDQRVLAGGELAGTQRGSGQSLVPSDQASSLQFFEQYGKASTVRRFLRRCIQLIKRNVLLFLLVVFAMAFIVYRKGHKLREVRAHLADFISRRAEAIKSQNQ